ncbi:MAG: 5-oxoprolinase subunit PxpB [Acidobacteria bacterium]|nr:5-oxoprolinase subunit PxpB [Acidobacteriota bacterium]
MSAAAATGGARVREAGDSALLLELDPVIDAEVNARVVAIAEGVRRRAIRGVRDVVSTFRSVAVFFDPLSTDVGTLAAALRDLSGVASGSGPTTGRRIDIPVAYGGELGPDLDEVAAFAGCPPQAVIDRHASQTYRVFMLGFLPGFAYMASVDQRIASPRRATPRVRIPAGSVGIAGRQTAIYPLESPGGWQIIGRTWMSVFDAERTPPALFSSGDQVRFVPTTATARFQAPREGAPYDRTSHQRRAGLYSPPPSDRHVTVLRPGLLTTVQDSGRWGFQHLGVPVSGPMDPLAHRLANAIVGNPSNAATLEATVLGPELRVEGEARMAVTGADLGATLDGSDVPLDRAVACRGGSVLRFGGRRAGARAYVAFDGGINAPPVLGSRATHVLSRLGGIEGRAIRAADRIPLGEATSPPARQADLHVRLYDPGRADGGARVRVLPGPQVDQFPPDILDRLERTRFTVSPASDRMGYRLTGGPLPARVAASEMISDVTVPGGLQVPPSGDPILLMADRQTTGGYPQVAIVITADLPLAAQLAPGDWVEFSVCTRAEALAALVAQEGPLRAVR